MQKTPTSAVDPERERSRAALVAFYRQGKIAQQARQLRVAGFSAPHMHAVLLARGFAVVKEPLPAERGRAGEPRWRLRDGSSTTVQDAEGIVTRMVYAHADGTLVIVYPAGDPLGRSALREPSAMKVVPFVPPEMVAKDPSERPRLVLDSSWSNVAFFVDDAGAPVPVREEGSTPVASYQAAVALRARYVLPLAR